MAVGVAMVLLSGGTAGPGAAVRDHFDAAWPQMSPATDLQADADGPSSFEAEGGLVAWIPVAAPFPWSELEGPCATSILWADAAQAVQAHGGHVIVSVSGDLEPVRAASLLTRAVASIVAASPTAIGVYWGAATLLVPGPMFVDFAKEVLPLGPPVHIWVDFRVGHDEAGGVLGFTQGMEGLGHPEIEAVHVLDTVADLREFLTALAGYLLEHGPVIEEGHTVGGTEVERIVVSFGPSALGLPGRVMRLGTVAAE